MKIDHTVKSIAAGTITGDRPSQARAAPAGNTAPGGAKVELSALSSRLHAIEVGLEDAKIVDSARVAEIKQAISEGRFRVNSEVVADRLIDTVKELIRAHKA